MSRDVRSRQRDLLAGIDLADVPGTSPTPRMLVRVYDGGAIPTTVPKVYLTHPVTADADDAEGATPGYSAESATIPVVVLGPTAPSAGDYLVAHAIGGRWVAGMGGGEDREPCSPCGIPKQDLTGTFVDTPLAPETIALAYSPLGGGSWSGIDGSASLLFVLECVAGAIVLSITQTADGLPWVGSAPIVIADYTCSPFHVHFDIGPGGLTDFYADA